MNSLSIRSNSVAVTTGKHRWCALFLAVAAGASGCSDSTAVQSEPLEVEAIPEAAAESIRDVGDDIASHSLYPEFSDHVTEEFAAVLQTLAARDADDVAALVETLRDCSSDSPASCIPTLTKMGLSAEGVRWDAAQAREIATELGLDSFEPEYVAGAFRRAQWLRDGSGRDSAMLSVVLDGADVECDDECLDTLGLVLGTIKGDHMAYMAQGGGGDDSEGGNGGGAAVVVGIVTAVVSAVLKIEDVWWNSNEEDKACEDDSDCPSSEYCHKVGDNDCRPKLPQGALCSRGGNCLSNCCKPHISAAFLPICRPADKCN